TVDRFQECFLGEGNVDVVAAIRILHRHGFDGCLIDDHVPHMEGDGDAGWPERGHAWSTGYLLGLIRGVTGT
ncbi:MAG: mannonate dehydratase, partial [Chloroflexi bacterium]|nr:mannonate dehydratase [Chloroflexota bacterium]